MDKGIQRIGKPMDAIEKSMENVGALELYKLEKNLSIISIVARIAPYLVFLELLLECLPYLKELPQSTEYTPNTIADGIYIKMITSATGLIIGILAYIGHSYLAAQINRIENKMEIASSRIRRHSCRSQPGDIIGNNELNNIIVSIRKKYKNEDTELDTGPLNDILFILMFFFLIISTLANPNVIKMNNPRATSETKAKQSVIVSINKNRDIYLGQQKIIFDSLESSLKKQLRIGDSIKPAVVINADSLVSWGDIVRVMQVAKKLGATTSASVSSAK